MNNRISARMIWAFETGLSEFPKPGPAAPIGLPLCDKNRAVNCLVGETPFD